MNWEQATNNWDAIKGKVKANWAMLTTNDVDSIKGEKEKLITKLTERYGYTRERAEREFERFMTSCKDTVPKNREFDGESLL